MCKNQKFFLCKHCGNLVGVIHDSGVPMICCGEPMTEIIANTVDASREKHVPVVKTEGSTVTVTVGGVLHPMLPEHHIAWIYLMTEQGGQRKCLEAGNKPEAEFSLTPGDRALEAYAYCNLHGLWKSEIL